MNRTYVLSVMEGELTIGDSKVPKYRVAINLQTKFTFVQEQQLVGFSIEYHNKPKVFHASNENLLKLKKLLDAKLLYCNMNEFYRPLIQLGEGAFSKVVMVEQMNTKQHLAAKHISKERKGRHEYEQMIDICNEIDIILRLQHPNIIKIRELYDKGNEIVIIHDYIDGKTLEQYISDRSIPLAQTDIQHIIRQILLALVYIHEHGILHRDIKPENIMLEKNMNVILIDFGLAIKQSHSLRHPKCGTPGYIAPEIINISSQTGFYSNKCDMFSLGVVFYKLITQQDLYRGKDMETVLSRNHKYDFDLSLVYEFQIVESCVDLLHKLLEYDSNVRISARDALAHPYFKDSLRPSALKKSTLCKQTMSTALLQQSQDPQTERRQTPPIVISKGVSGSNSSRPSLQSPVYTPVQQGIKKQYQFQTRQYQNITQL